MGESTKTNQQEDDKKTKRFWSKIWERGEHRKVEWISNMKKVLEWLEEAQKTKIHLDSLRATRKNVPNLKTPGHNGKHVYWFKKLTFIHDRLAIERNRCPQKQICTNIWQKERPPTTTDPQPTYQWCGKY